MKGHAERISLIVLAAGKSSRFGSNKLLMKLNGETLIRRVVRKGLESRADEVVVVAGYEAEKIAEALKDLHCRLVLNPAFEKGQSSSVVAGVRFVRSHAKAAMILPADMPFLEVADIDRVIDEFNCSGASLVAASYEGRIGHPILFGVKLFDEVLRIKEETFGLKEIVRRYHDKMKLAETGSRGVLVDVDVPGDFERLGAGI